MAAIALIEEADTHGWEKEDLERHGNSEAADQFYAAILYAVARHYAVDALDAQSSPRVYEVLVDLLAQIVNNGRLDQVMRHYGQKPGDGDEM